jgi:hypothetical protein
MQTNQRDDQSAQKENCSFKPRSEQEAFDFKQEQRMNENELADSVHNYLHKFKRITQRFAISKRRVSTDDYSNDDDENEPRNLLEQIDMNEYSRHMDHHRTHSSTTTATASDSEEQTSPSSMQSENLVQSNDNTTNENKCESAEQRMDSYGKKHSVSSDSSTSSTTSCANSSLSSSGIGSITQNAQNSNPNESVKLLTFGVTKNLQPMDSNEHQLSNNDENYKKQLFKSNDVFNCKYVISKAKRKKYKKHVPSDVAMQSAKDKAERKVMSHSQSMEDLTNIDEDNIKFRMFKSNKRRKHSESEFLLSNFHKTFNFESKILRAMNEILTHQLILTRKVNEINCNFDGLNRKISDIATNLKEKKEATLKRGLFKDDDQSLLQEQMGSMCDEEQHKLAKMRKEHHLTCFNDEVNYGKAGSPVLSISPVSSLSSIDQQSDSAQRVIPLCTSPLFNSNTKQLGKLSEEHHVSRLKSFISKKNETESNQNENVTGENEVNQVEKPSSAPLPVEEEIKSTSIFNAYPHVRLQHSYSISNGEIARGISYAQRRAIQAAQAQNMLNWPHPFYPGSNLNNHAKLAFNSLQHIHRRMTNNPTEMNQTKAEYNAPTLGPSLSNLFANSHQSSSISALIDPQIAPNHSTHNQQPTNLFSSSFSNQQFTCSNKNGQHSNQNMPSQHGANMSANGQLNNPNSIFFNSAFPSSANHPTSPLIHKASAPLTTFTTSLAHSNLNQQAHTHPHIHTNAQSFLKNSFKMDEETNSKTAALAAAVAVAMAQSQTHSQMNIGSSGLSAGSTSSHSLMSGHLFKKNDQIDSTHLNDDHEEPDNSYDSNNEEENEQSSGRPTSHIAQSSTNFHGFLTHCSSSIRHVPCSLVDQLDLSKEVQGLISKDIIKRCIRKAKHRGNFAANLAAELFSKEERITCNCTGTRGKRQLSPRRLQIVKEITFRMYNSSPALLAAAATGDSAILNAAYLDFEEAWRKECITAIDAKNRSIGRDSIGKSVANDRLASQFQSNNSNSPINNQINNNQSELSD